MCTLNTFDKIEKCIQDKNSKQLIIYFLNYDHLPSLYVKSQTVLVFINYKSSLEKTIGIFFVYREICGGVSKSSLLEMSSTKDTTLTIL